MARSPDRATLGCAGSGDPRTTVGYFLLAPFVVGQRYLRIDKFPFKLSFNEWALCVSGVVFYLSADEERPQNSRFSKNS